jgi:hypothetical protein
MCQFVNNITKTLLNKAITKIKLVDLDELTNFYVDNFFS